jgi:hypothetical protein
MACASHLGTRACLLCLLDSGTRLCLCTTTEKPGFDAPLLPWTEPVLSGAKEWAAAGAFSSRRGPGEGTRNFGFWISRL